MKAIKLPQPESEPSGDAYISGWGSTSRDRYPLMPDILQHAQLDYVDLKTCDDAVKRLTGSSPVHETNVCTGPLNGARSACSVSKSSCKSFNFNNKKIFKMKFNVTFKICYIG